MFNESSEITVTWLRYLNYHIGYLFLPYQISELLVLLADKMVGIPGLLTTASTNPVELQDANYPGSDS